MTLSRHSWFALLVVSGCATPAVDAPRTILIDGDVSEWEAEPPLAEAAPALEDTALGILRLWAADDDARLLLRFDLTREITLQSDNGLALCLDGDHNVATGTPDVPGADVCWRFGDRRGTYYAGNDTVPLVHQSLGFVSAPTVTARSFEVSIALAARPAADHPLFTGDTIGITLATGSPGRALHAEYVLGTRHEPPVRPLTLEKANPAHLRVVTYNLNDRLTDPSRRESLGRILGALQPDVLLLQEIRRTPLAAAAAYVEALLAHAPRWRAVKVGGESSVVLSPFPILQADSLGESGAVVLDLASRPEGGELLIVVLSAPCCRLEAERQREFDMIIDYLRDAREPGGRVSLPPGTPMLLMGDANMVGAARQRTTLLEGAIVDEATFGPSFLPDWDMSPLTDLAPRHTHAPFAYTWYGDEFPPGRLDYVIYGDSRLGVGNRFVLDTSEMPVAALRSAGLRGEDTGLVSDHLPVVADMDFGPR